MLTSVFFNPCTFVDSHTKVQEHDTDFMACLIGSKFGVTGRSSRLAFHVVPPFPSPYSFEVATYERGTPQGSTLALFSLSQIDDWLHVALSVHLSCLMTVLTCYRPFCALSIDVPAVMASFFNVIAF